MTKDMRERIVRAAKAETFDGRKAKIATMEHELAGAIRRTVLGTKTLELLDALPDGIAPTRNKLAAQLAGHYEQLKLGSDERFPSKVTTYDGTICLDVFDGSHPLAEQYELFRAEDKKLANDMKSIEARLTALVNSYSTVERLVEAWPDGERYIPKPKDAVLVVPAVLVSDVIAEMQAAKAA
ncbi:MAG TPA: Nmad5 family putative nucleotide modification protein [Candidatus Sulfotelmatobacter sp.]|nr:Nmad5 family putative nucleotide modification protein [Candidatus Sulfotelmatobacter sp.]